MVDDFGSGLRNLRKQRGLRQIDLVAALDGQFARSTIANIEAGREPPSPRFWEALCAAFPTHVEDLTPLYDNCRRKMDRPNDRPDPSTTKAPAPQALGGPFAIDRLDLAYTFRESRAPEEFIEVRTVRALRDRADRYLLKMRADNSEGFRITPETLWGGHIVDTQVQDRGGGTVTVRDFRFDHLLSRGQRHTFAMRTWIEKDPNPDTSIDVSVTLPTEIVAVHVNFEGPKPVKVWRHGPVADEYLIPASGIDPHARSLRGHDGHYSSLFARPEPGTYFGIGWAWE